MVEQRVGRIVRALRRRRGWRQLDLARAASCSQPTISLLERGHVGHMAVDQVGRVLAALDAALVLEVRWRAGALDRLLDEDHASLVGSVAERLARRGWDAQVEVSYSHFGERGSFDILAFRADVAVALAVEVKTDIASAEATLRKLDEKARLAVIVGRERFGWHVRHVGRLLVLPTTSTARRRVGRHAALFERALPARGAAIRRWLEQPMGPAAGLLFVSDISARNGMRGRGGRERARRPNSRLGNHRVNI